MLIVMITPVAKADRLGDVVFGLGREMEIFGNAVEIVRPKYAGMRYGDIWGLQPSHHDLPVPWYGGPVQCTVWFGFARGRMCFFVEPHLADDFFGGDLLHGYGEDEARFAFFSKAALEFLLQSGKRPEVIHCHDWQTGLVPVLVCRGRLAEDFKPITGAHVRVGAVRGALLPAMPMLSDVLIAGENRGCACALAWLNAARALRLLGEEPQPRGEPILHEVVHRLLAQALADHNAAAGSAARIERLVVMARPTDPDGGEITDKRYVNQRQVLIDRSTLVELLYAQPTPADVIVAGTAGRTA